MGAGLQTSFLGPEVLGAHTSPEPWKWKPNQKHCMVSTGWLKYPVIHRGLESQKEKKWIFVVSLLINPSSNVHTVFPPTHFSACNPFARVHIVIHGIFEGFYLVIILIEVIFKLREYVEIKLWNLRIWIRNISVFCRQKSII